MLVSVFKVWGSCTRVGCQSAPIVEPGKPLEWLRQHIGDAAEPA